MCFFAEYCKKMCVKEHDCSKHFPRHRNDEIFRQLWNDTIKSLEFLQILKQLQNIFPQYLNMYISFEKKLFLNFRDSRFVIYLQNSPFTQLILMIKKYQLIQPNIIFLLTKFPVPNPKYFKPFESCIFVEFKIRF